MKLIKPDLKKISLPPLMHVSRDLLFFKSISVLFNLLILLGFIALIFYFFF